MKTTRYWITVWLAAFALMPVSGQLASERTAGRLLDQAAFGPWTWNLLDVQRVGIESWILWQQSITYSDIPDQPILLANGNVNLDLQPVTRAFYFNASYMPDQLRQRAAFALSKIWVVSAASTRPAYAYPPYWRIMRDNAFGNYRDLIRAVTLSPAMGNFLNMANNNKANPRTGALPNENYARELLQLFTLGLVQLNMNGTPVLDANGKPLPTFDQSAITELSRALTGWTYPNTPGRNPSANNPQYYFGQMIPFIGNHDTAAKAIFGGVQIPANQTPEQDLESVLNALMAQRTMAPFISKQLIQQLVTSNPSPAYIERIANVFWDNGQGVRGDLKAVIRAILLDPEARAGDDPNFSMDPNFGRMREPVLFMVNMIRGLGGVILDNSTINTRAAQMGQDLFNAPSVFSYFSPNYRTEKGLLGPEFQIYNTQTASNRANIVNAILYGTLDRGTVFSTDPAGLVGKANVSLEAMMDGLNYVFFYRSMPQSLYNAAYTAAAAQTGSLNRVRAALYVALTSGEYQIIR